MGPAIFLHPVVPDIARASFALMYVQLSVYVIPVRGEFRDRI